MIAHGSSEIQALAHRCTVVPVAEANGWKIDLWELSDEDVDAAVAAYDAVIFGHSDDRIAALLEEEGVDLGQLLRDDDSKNDTITRSDLTELIAVASLVATSGCRTEVGFLPNVPKMARGKSESGIDAMFIELDPGCTGDLSSAERLDIVSVKHTIKTDTVDMRNKLQTSLSEKELSPLYLAQQLRVVVGRMGEQGRGQEEANRAYLFLKNFPSPDHVRLFGLAFADIDAETSLRQQLSRLPKASGARRFARGVLIPEIAIVHEKCS